MDLSSIEREIHRLAPWYYDLDLGGVRTSISPPCDDWGHRPLDFPEIRPGFWAGRTVLDAACNEGAWSFGARRAGAVRVDAFDVRPENIEKARFVQQVWGVDNVDFHVASCDSWIAEHGDRHYDVVMLCGILYHLVDPARTIEQFCGIADRRIFVSCVLWGGAELGWTRYHELDNIAASADSLDSLMPNNANTLLREFAKHGFRPTHVAECGYGAFGGGGCYLLLENQAAHGAVVVEREFGSERTHAGTDGPRCDVYLGVQEVADAAGRERPVDVTLAVYNHGDQPWAGTGRIVATDAAGTVLAEQGPTAVELPRRSPPGDRVFTHSVDHVVGLDLAGATGPVTVDVVLEDASGAVAASNRLTIGG